MLTTRVVTLAANERSTHGSAKQESNARTAQTVIRAPETDVDVLNRLAGNTFEFTTATGSQVKCVRRYSLNHTHPRDSTRRNVDTGACAGRDRDGVLATKGLRRAYENPEEKNKSGRQHPREIWLLVRGDDYAQIDALFGLRFLMKRARQREHETLRSHAPGADVNWARPVPSACTTQMWPISSLSGTVKTSREPSGVQQSDKLFGPIHPLRT